jgi:hypothetical protein
MCALLQWEPKFWIMLVVGIIVAHSVLWFQLRMELIHHHNLSVSKEALVMLPHIIAGLMELTKAIHMHMNYHTL